MVRQTPFWKFDVDHQIGGNWDIEKEFQTLEEDALRYGPLADRPAASDLPDGRKYLDENGVVSEAVGDGWVAQPLGTAENPIPEQHVQKTTTEQTVVTDQVIRVYGLPSGGSYQDYRIGAYADIGAAINQAYADTKAANRSVFQVELPKGEFDFSTQIVSGLPTTITGQGSPTVWALVAGAPRNGTSLRWQGGTEDPIRIENNADTPTTHLNGVALSDFGVEHGANSSANKTVVIDAGADTIRGIRYGNFLVEAGANQGLDHLGVVFDIRSYRLQALADDTNRGVNGGDSQITHVDPYLYGTTGDYVLRQNAMGFTMIGGTVAPNNGADGIKVGSAGGVYGTRIEGNDNGGVGLTYTGSGPFDIKPAAVTNLDTAVQIGESNVNAANSRLDFNTSSILNEDVLITAGGSRADTTFLMHGYSVTDNRLSTDGVDQKVGVPWVRDVQTVTYATDSTGLQNNTVYPEPTGPYDNVDIRPTGYSDGDFGISQPTVSDLTRGGGIDVVADVTTASATAGATCTFDVIVEKYTV